MDYLKDSSLRLVNPQQIYKIVHGDTFKVRYYLFHCAIAAEQPFFRPVAS